MTVIPLDSIIEGRIAHRDFPEPVGAIISPSDFDSRANFIIRI